MFKSGENYDGEGGDFASAERQLWCAVIGRAVQDAMDQIGTVSGTPERFKLRQDAREWFVHNGTDFRIACESAGYDPDEIRRRILNMIDGAAANAAAANSNQHQHLQHQHQR